MAGSKKVKNYDILPTSDWSDMISNIRMQITLPNCSENII
jgi:hypothetical protein